MIDNAKYIRFDWAMKRLLRQKANFAILEGLLTTLLGEKITIQHMLESESNQESEYDKYNRVDMLAEDSKGQLILIEVQNNTEFAYFQRMLFGTSKLVTEYAQRGKGYDQVKKIYSINIVYFNLGNGIDYVYHGTTEFRGIHKGDVLRLSPFQMNRFQAKSVSDLFPEYYVLKVNDFNRVATNPLEEWIYFLNTGDIPDTVKAPGLAEARQQLMIDQMSKAERAAYDRQIDNRVIFQDSITGSYDEGRWDGQIEGRKKGREEGRAEGREEGREEAKREMVRSMLANGLSVEQAAKVAGLTESEVEKLK